MSRKQLFGPEQLTPQQVIDRADLQARLKTSVERVKGMSPRAYERMKRQQAQSWARQDMD